MNQKANNQEINIEVSCAFWAITVVILVGISLGSKISDQQHKQETDIQGTVSGGLCVNSRGTASCDSVVIEVFQRKV